MPSLSNPSSRLLNARVREAAANWAIRLDAADCPLADMNRFHAWLDADPAHRAAFDEARALWLELEAPALESMRRASPPPTSRSWTSLGFGYAAVLLAAIAVTVFLRDDLLLKIRADHRTASGESRWLTLEDGSRVQLNTDTAVAIDYSARRRQITLLRGEAAFEVAHEAARPFRVIAADGVTTALGTVFQVRIDRLERNDAAQVVVTQGRVHVQAGSDAKEIVAGEQIDYSAEQLGDAHAVDVETASAWRRGRLSFIDQPLGIVVRELDRYYPGHIRFADPALAQRRVSGVFATGKPLAALDSIERNLGVSSERSANEVILKNFGH